MWNKLQEMTQHPAMKFLKKLAGDPVQIYAVFLVTTVMYYYQSGMTWLYTVLAVLASWLMMRLYDFIAKQKYKVVSFMTYLVYMTAGLQIIRLLTQEGRKDYPISFMVWFLTPQQVVSFSGWYTVSIYLLMLGFLTSVVYYFSKIRYRMSMQFLIMLIPLSLYAKEGLQMPAVLVMILLASYFLLMIYCRQLHNPEQIRSLPNFYGSMSIAVYVMAFSILAAIIPKPEITADREFIENAMSYSSWSDVLMNAISMFTDTTDNSVGSSNNSRTIYYVQSPESLRLRTQTYSYYQEDDSWTVLRRYDYPNQIVNPVQDLTYQPRQLLQTILDAASQDATFAETYHLSDFAGVILPPQEKNTVSILPWYIVSSQVFPSPTRTTSINNSESNNIKKSETDTFQGAGGYGWSNITYYSDIYANYEAVLPVLKSLSKETYQNLLTDAQEILTDPEQIALLKKVQEEAEKADAYFTDAKEIDFRSDIISQLSEEITAGLTSDFDKAKAIEQYFIREGFVYDQAYQKPLGANAVSFLIQSKKGVCYEYATAMVLLCRAAGLPARYVQGYNLNEMYNREIDGHQVNYLIKVRDAHAFPEVYISGYGWLSFEPTVPSDEITDGTAENQHITEWGFVLLGLALLAFVIYLLMPRIRENLFRKRILTMTPQESASAIFQHMRRILRLPDSTTVCELAEHSRPFCPESALFSALDVLLYSHETEKPMTSPQLAETYCRWQANHVQFLKEEAQKQKLQAKAKRKER